MYGKRATLKLIKLSNHFKNGKSQFIAVIMKFKIEQCKFKMKNTAK